LFLADFFDGQSNQAAHQSQLKINFRSFNFLKLGLENHDGPGSSEYSNFKFNFNHETKKFELSKLALTPIELMSNNSNFSGDLQVISTIISSGQQRFLAPGLTHYRKSEDRKLLELDIFDIDSEQFVTYAVDTDTIENIDCFESN
jgi:hypothetical protein